MIDEPVAIVVDAVVALRHVRRCGLEEGKHRRKALPRVKAMMLLTRPDEEAQVSLQDEGRRLCQQVVAKLERPYVIEELGHAPRVQIDADPGLGLVAYPRQEVWTRVRKERLRAYAAECLRELPAQIERAEPGSAEPGYGGVLR